MSDNQPLNSESDSPAAPQTGSNMPSDWREERRQARAGRRAERQERREVRREARGASAWIVGLVLIVLGVAFMAQNFGAFALHNWWALFILIPAVSSLAVAFRIYSNTGTLSAAAIGPFFVGVILFGITAAFLFDLDWGLVGPVVLILLGLSALVGTFARRT